MGDIEVIVTKDGLKLCRIERTGKGRRVRVKGSETLAKDIAEINLEGPLFENAAQRTQRLGVSYDRRSG